MAISRDILSSIVERRILVICGQRVMLDNDLADLYEVQTKDMNRAVRRNVERFPKEFMFQLTREEYRNLRCQFVTSSSEHGGKRYLPFVFTEQGVAMLSSVLNSPRAIQVNIVIMKTFARLREVIGGNQAVLKRLDALEKKSADHDAKIGQVFQAIREMLAPPEGPRKKIGIRP